MVGLNIFFVSHIEIQMCVALCRCVYAVLVVFSCTNPFIHSLVHLFRELCSVHQQNARKKTTSRKNPPLTFFISTSCTRVLWRIIMFNYSFITYDNQGNKSIVRIVRMAYQRKNWRQRFTWTRSRECALHTHTHTHIYLFCARLLNQDIYRENNVQNFPVFFAPRQFQSFSLPSYFSAYFILNMNAPMSSFNYCQHK